MKEISKTWVDFKSLVINRSLRPQYDYFIDYVVNNGIASESQYVNIYGLDGFLLFITTLQSDTDEFNDFESNYKDSWNAQLTFTDPTGIQQVIPSARPIGTTTFFTGKGDNNVTLDFNFPTLLPPASIVKDLTFNEDIYIKDGGMMFENAPFGAYFNVDVVHPQAGVVAKFCRNIFILGTGSYELNSEDKSLLVQGLILRVTVFNAPTPVAFKAVGSLEGFRATMT